MAALPVALWGSLDVGWIGDLRSTVSAGSETRAEQRLETRAEQWLAVCAEQRLETRAEQWLETRTEQWLAVCTELLRWCLSQVLGQLRRKGFRSRDPLVCHAELVDLDSAVALQVGIMVHVTDEG